MSDSDEAQEHEEAALDPEPPEPSSLVEPTPTREDDGDAPAAEGDSGAGAGPAQATAANEGGPSLVFSGGGDFLAKYQHLYKQQREQTRNRKRGPPSNQQGGPEKVNVHLNKLLVQAWTTDGILQVVGTHMEQFNAVNLITALHRMATVVTGTRRASLRRDSRFKRLINRLLDVLRSTEVGQLKPQDLSNAAWALTKLGLLNVVLFELLSEHSRAIIGAFEPVNLSMTLWAFARAGRVDERLFREACEQVKKQLDMFQPQQIANTTWAMAKSGFIDEELFMKAADVVLSKLSDYQPMNYSMLLYSFALAKLKHATLFSEIALRCSAKDLMQAASAPHVITNLATAYFEVGAADEKVFDEIAEAARATLPKFRTQQIAKLAEAFAGAKIKNEPLFAAISSAVVIRLGEFRQQELQELLGAYERLQLPTTDIARAVRMQAAQEQGMSNKWQLSLSAMLAVFFLVSLLWRFLMSPASPK